MPTQARTFVSYESDHEEEQATRMRGPSPYASFTDIAAMVSRIDPPVRENNRESSRGMPHRQLSWPVGAYEGFSDSDSSEVGFVPVSSRFRGF